MTTITKVKSTVKLQKDGYVRLPKEVIQHLGAVKGDFLTVTVSDIYTGGELMPPPNQAKVIHDGKETTHRKRDTDNTETTA